MNSRAAASDCGASAVGPITIALGSNTYKLSIAGADAGNATGDLNVAGNVSDLRSLALARGPR